MTTDHRDAATFTSLTEVHRRELHVHCYRMLASFEEAEDAVQVTLLKAWRARDSYEDGTNLRAWLYRIATNVCLDVVRKRSRQATQVASPHEVPWLQPYPDRLFAELAPTHDAPDDAAVGRETVELAFLVALQVLPPRQRAVLLLRDVLAMTAAETADLLGTTVAAANSALQRARATMADHLPSHRTEWTAPTVGEADRELLEKFIDAHERYDADAALAAAAPDIRITMPPHPMVFEGRDSIVPLLERAFGPDREGEWHLLPTAANRMPAAASYLQRPGDTVYRPYKLDVLRVERGMIAEITTFAPNMFDALDLPPTL